MLNRRVLLSIAAAALLPVGAAFAAAMTAQAYEPAAFKAAQDSGKPILVEIHAVWCPTCKAQSAVLEPMLKQDAFKGMAVFRVDFDGQAPVVKGFHANTQSTLIVFKGATEVARAVGVTNPAAIEALLRMAI